VKPRLEVMMRACYKDWLQAWNKSGEPLAINEVLFRIEAETHE
jgi:hypothetical protein